MAHKKVKILGDIDGNCPLHFAAALGRVDLVKKCLAFGENVNMGNRLGWTPVMQAARNGHVLCVEILVRHGADVTMRNDFGISTFSLACASGNLPTISVVLKSALQRESVRELQTHLSPIFVAILFDQIEVLRYLINNSFNLNPTCSLTGLTPLGFADILNNNKIMEILKRRGARPVQLRMSGNNSLLSRLSPIPQTAITLSPIVSRKLSCPFLNSSASSLDTSFRRCSNVTASPNSQLISPNLSPIIFSFAQNDSSLHRNSPKQVLNMSRDKRLNERIRLSHNSDIEATIVQLDSNAKILDWFAELKSKDKKSKSVSCAVNLPSVNPEVEEDEVFYTSTNEIQYQKKKNDKKFIELLRRNSLDSCISLFEKHEIDLDVFLTLNQNDLREIGVDRGVENTILYLIHELNK